MRHHSSSHIFAPFASNITFNIINPSTPRSTLWSLFFMFSYEFLWFYRVSSVPFFHFNSILLYLISSYYFLLVFKYRPQHCVRRPHCVTFPCCETSKASKFIRNVLRHYVSVNEELSVEEILQWGLQVLILRTVSI